MICPSNFLHFFDFSQQIDDVKLELKEVEQMADEFEADLSEESEGKSLELLGSQVIPATFSCLFISCYPFHFRVSVVGPSMKLVASTSMDSSRLLDRI